MFLVFCKDSKQYIGSGSGSMPYMIQCPHCPPPTSRPEEQGYLGGDRWKGKELRRFNNNRYGDSRDIRYRHFIIRSQRLDMLQKLRDFGFSVEEVGK